MDKLKMQTADGTMQNIERIAQLFPNCVTEVMKDGKETLAIDFDRLRQELSDHVVEGNDERYQFTWPDKRKAQLAANAPISATLRPCREESVDFDTTGNLYIEGDNLDVLKCLKETYSGKIKMIYIDPPYNTGKDFVYNDDFAESASEYLANSGQYDDQGNRLVENAESNGRFHTNWLNMIYPRLKVARDLLTEDGVIFISIDDHELRNLRNVCDEIFGEVNFVNNFMWLHGKGKKDKWSRTLQQYILSYAKNKSLLAEWNEKDYTNYEFSNPDNDPKGKWFSGSLSFSEERSNPLHPNYFTVTSPTGVVWKRQWQISEEEMNDLINNGDISWGNPCTMDGVPRQKIRPSVIDIIPNNIFDNCGTTKSASTYLSSLMGKECFSYPKPVELMEKLLEITNIKDGIILDFFSGSSTMAQAIFQNNIQMQKQLNFIMVQLPESLDENLKQADAYNKPIIKNAISICDSIPAPRKLTEVAKERIRRAGKKIKAENPNATALDTGFRVLKLADSNMLDVYYSPAEVVQQDLFAQADNIKSDRTPEDLLFQVMLELGVLLDSKIEVQQVAGKQIYNVANGFLIACFDKGVTDEVITAIAKQHPQYAVLRDSSYADDSTATNFEQLFKTYSPSTTIKTL